MTKMLHWRDVNTWEIAMKGLTEKHSIKNNENFELELGNVISLTSDRKLKYKVTQTFPELILKLEGKANSAPAEFKVERVNGKRKIILRDEDSHFSNFPEISDKQHATIIFSKNKQKFVYTHGSPTIDAVIESAQKTPRTQDEISKDIADIDSLIKIINPDKLKIAKKLEHATFITPKEERKNGGKSEESLNSYATLLEGYLLLNRNILTQKGVEQLEENIQIIRELEEDRIFLREIEQNPKHQKDIHGVYDKNKRAGYSYNDDLNKLINKKYAALEKSGKTHTVIGIRGHHEIAKYSKLGSNGNPGHHQTTHNSGFEARQAPTNPTHGKVMGTAEEPIKDSSERGIKDLMRTNFEKKIREYNPEKPNPIQSKNYQVLTKEASAFLGKIVRYNEVDEQHKGNCTTRSTREMLRDNLDRQLFKSVYDFVATPENVSHDLGDCLEARKQELIVEAKLVKEQAALLANNIPQNLLGAQKPVAVASPYPVAAVNPFLPVFNMSPVTGPEAYNNPFVLQGNAQIGLNTPNYQQPQQQPNPYVQQVNAPVAGPAYNNPYGSPYNGYNGNGVGLNTPNYQQPQQQQPNPFVQQVNAPVAGPAYNPYGSPYNGYNGNGVGLNTPNYQQPAQQQPSPFGQQLNAPVAGPAYNPYGSPYNGYNGNGVGLNTPNYQQPAQPQQPNPFGQQLNAPVAGPAYNNPYGSPYNGYNGNGVGLNTPNYQQPQQPNPFGQHVQNYQQQSPSPFLNAPAAHFNDPAVVALQGQQGFAAKFKPETQKFVIYRANTTKPVLAIKFEDETKLSAFENKFNDHFTMQKDKNQPILFIQPSKGIGANGVLVTRHGELSLACPSDDGIMNSFKETLGLTDNDARLADNLIIFDKDRLPPTPDKNKNITTEVKMPIASQILSQGNSRY
jgi:hypothetical protein